MSGYERNRFVNISEEDKIELTCSVCQQIFRNPVIADCCLQAFCEICIHEWLRNESTCPYDRKQLTLKELRPAPRLLNNLLGKLQIYCEFREKGCKEVIRLEELSQHLDVCPFNIRVCNKCFCMTSVDHNCVQQLLDLSKKDNKLIESLRNEKEVFRQLFQEIKDKYKEEKSILNNEKNVLAHSIKQLAANYEKEIQALKQENQKLQAHLKELENDQIKGLYRTSSTLSLDSRPSFSKMISEARMYVNQRVTITESNADEEVAKRIVEIVKNEIKNKNNMYFICENIVQKCDYEFGSSWGCIANYNKHGNNFTNSSCFVKLTFGKLNFKIYRTKFLDVSLLRRRFREGQINREIKIFDTDMTPEKIKIVENMTFSVIEKSKTLKAIVKFLQSNLESHFGGKWICFGHNFGDYSIHRKEGSFISFDLAELKLTLFQTN